MQFHGGAAQQRDEAQIDRVMDLGEAFARLRLDLDDLQSKVAAHCGGPRYIDPGTSAVAAVMAQRARR